MQAHIPSLKPQPCDIYDIKSQCEKIHGGNAAFFYIALYSVAVGLAGAFAGVPSHGADQFDDKDPKELRHMSSFFNYLTASNAIGSILSLTLVVWIQTHVGWDWGFGTSAACVFVATLIFAVGVPKYRIHAIGGPNPIVQILQVINFFFFGIFNDLFCFILFFLRVSVYVKMNYYLYMSVKLIFTCRHH